MENISKTPLSGAVMQPNLGILTPHAASCATLLNKLLADEFLLYTKTLNYHWNIVSPHFGPMHLFFEKQYEQLSTIVDDVAERVRALGHPALGTMKEFLKATQLEEQAGTLSEVTMIKNLLADHEAIIRSVRIDQKTAMDEYNDAGTNNFLCDLIEKHEKMAWMLRSFVSKSTCS